VGVVSNGGCRTSAQTAVRAGLTRPLNAPAEPIPGTLTWINTVHGLSTAVLCRRWREFQCGLSRLLVRRRFRTTPYYRCSYTTMDQCRASANGQMCSLNPYYAGATARARRNTQRSYRYAGPRSPAPAETGSYAPPGPPVHRGAAPYNLYNEPYYGASQG
jgi:hypothetical protein